MYVITHASIYQSGLVVWSMGCDIQVYVRLRRSMVWCVRYTCFGCVGFVISTIYLFGGLLSLSKSSFVSYGSFFMFTLIVNSGGATATVTATKAVTTKIMMYCIFANELDHRTVLYV